MTAPLTVWCNARFPEPALDLLRQGTSAHRLVLAVPKSSNLVGGAPDPLLDDADVAFGQPDPEQIMRTPRLRWVHLDSAGYTRYDLDDLQAALRVRNALLTNSSSVYDEPCAQHVLSLMLAHARQLPQSVLDQHRDDRPWNNAERRAGSRLLGGQTALILGYGAIGRRLADLLAPFHMNVIATRRSPRGDEAVRVVSDDQTDALLPTADHVINILPANASTERFFTADRFGRFKPGAVFYNIGRGTTVDQQALIAALFNGHVSAAYLDVTDPEPLPPDHLLWRAPNCFITPHTAGGHEDEFERLVGHFVENLRRYERGEAMEDRIV